MPIEDFIARNFKPYSLANVMHNVEKSKMANLQIQGAEGAMARQETVTNLLNPYFKSPDATFAGAAKLVAPHDIKSAYMLGTIGNMTKKKGSKWSKPFVVGGNRYQKEQTTNQWRSLGRVRGKGGKKYPGYPTSQELSLTSNHIETYGDDAVKSLSRTGDDNDYDKFTVHVATMAREIQKDEGIGHTEAVKKAYNYYRQFVGDSGGKEFIVGDESSFINKIPGVSGISDWLAPDDGAAFTPPSIQGKTDSSRVFKKEQPTLEDTLAFYKEKYGDRFSKEQITKAYKDKYER